MSSIKELVKKHFNLVEARQSFGEVMTADGELTLTYEGDELAEGLAVFVVTADGNVPAPDGEHALEGGVTIVTTNGMIEAIKETTAEAPAEEIAAKKQKKMMEESPVEEAVADVIQEAISQEVVEAISEEVVEAVAEAVIESIGEMMKKMENRMAALEGKFSTFASAPAAEKTNAGKSSTTKFNSDLAPSRNKALVDKFIALKNKK